jgi:hypothetical protein
MNITQLHARVAKIEQSRFKDWYNPKYLAYHESQRAMLRQSFHMYLMLYDDLVKAGEESRQDGHNGKTALMAFCHTVIDRIEQQPQHVQVMDAIVWFIDHSAKHNCTPIWGEMNAIARDYLEKISTAPN